MRSARQRRRVHPERPLVLLVRATQEAAMPARLRTKREWLEVTGLAAIRRGNKYLILLVLLALGGQLMASYDFNLLVLTLPDIAKSLKLSATAVGSVGFFIYGGEFIVTLLAGYGMDRLGRKRVWQYNLLGTAVFTGLTYFVGNYWELVVVRTIAGAFAVAEFAMAATLVSEQAPRRSRGFLYSVVNGGYALGLLLAAVVYEAFIGLGWRVVFAWGVLPLVVLIFARRHLRESERWQHLREIKSAEESGDQEQVEKLEDRYDIPEEEVKQPSIRELLRTPGPVRRQLNLLTVVWICYASAYVATNVYITYWLTTYAGWTSGQAATLLLIGGGCGLAFYMLGGILGERFGRKEAMLCAGVLVAPLNVVFYFVSFHAGGASFGTAITWFFIYQATNGVWSGAGQGYWPESFPTSVRGTAVGWLGSMFALGTLIGAGIWTVMIGSVGPTVTWFVIGVGLALGQYAAFGLRHIEPDQDLDNVELGSDGEQGSESRASPQHSHRADQADHADQAGSTRRRAS
jgi:MFS family permease